MKKLDEETAYALTQLARGSREFEVFVRWLKTSLNDEMYQGVIAAQEPQRTWGQGRCQQLIEIIGSIEGAERTLSAFKGGKH